MPILTTREISPYSCLIVGENPNTNKHMGSIAQAHVSEIYNHFSENQFSRGYLRKISILNEKKMCDLYLVVIHQS